MTDQPSPPAFTPPPPPPPQPPGRQITRFEIDNELGQLSRQLANWSIRVRTFNGQLETLSDAQLKALGYDDDGVALVRAETDAFSSLDEAYGQLASTLRRTAGLIVPGMP